jgi:hypothetical protein
LIGTLLFWGASGWIAGYPFPIGQGFDLMRACFTGTIPTKVINLQKKLQNTDVVSQPDNSNQVKKLSILESEAWLYREILERLGSDPLADHKKVAKTIEALEYKRKEFLQELEPRRPANYRLLAEIQDSARELLASQAEKDFEQLQKIFTNLVIFARSRTPSQIILSEVTEKLIEEIAENSSKISPYRLRLAYRADELMRILSEKLILNASKWQSNNSYQGIISELRSRIRLLSNQFSHLLEENNSSKAKLSDQALEIDTLTRNIYSLSIELSNRDTDKASLRSNVGNISRRNQELAVREDELRITIEHLQNDLKQEINKKQKSEQKLKEIIENLSLANRRESELLEEIQVLSKRSRSQESIISQINDQESSYSTEDTLSEDLYQAISNKEDYEFVRGYTNSRSGKWVDEYYRRIPENRRKKRE